MVFGNLELPVKDQSERKRQSRSIYTLDPLWTPGHTPLSLQLPEFNAYINKRLKTVCVARQNKVIRIYSL